MVYIMRGGGYAETGWDSFGDILSVLTISGMDYVEGEYLFIYSFHMKFGGLVECPTLFVLDPIKYPHSFWLKLIRTKYRPWKALQEF